MTVFPEFGDLVRVSPEGERTFTALAIGYMQFSRFVAVVQDLDGPAHQINVDFIEIVTPQHDIPEAQRYRKLFISKHPGEVFPMAGDGAAAEPVVVVPPHLVQPDDEGVEEPEPPLLRTDVGDTLGVLPSGEDPMTAEEFAEWRKRMKVSKTKAAEMIGVSRNMPAKYEAGAVEIPLVVALACAALIRGIQPWPK